jgi:glutamate-1-semialdehyde aminotransferase
MKNYATQEIVPQGTYERNLVSLAAADVPLYKIKTGNAHSAIAKFGNSLVKGIQDILRDRKVNAIVQGYPSMFQVLFAKQERVDNYRDFLKCNEDLFAKL